MFSLRLLLFGAICSALQHNASYPLKVSKNNRHFVDSNGAPFFWQADTAWALFHRFNMTEVEMYLDDRAAKGFNMILSVGLSQFGPESPNRYGVPALNNYDLTQPNETYWDNVDSVVEMAWSKGIRIAFVPAWGYYIHNSNNVVGFDNVTLDASNSYAFGHWFAARYPDNPYILVADTNPIYTNESLYKSAYAAGGVQPQFNYTDYSPVYDALAHGLQAGSGKGHQALITIHPTNIWFMDTPSALASSFFNDRSWLTFDACQSGHTDYPPDVPMNWWNARRPYEPIGFMYGNDKVRPVLDNENHYEGRYDDGKAATPVPWNASNVRIAAFQSIFAGAAGFTYGADMVMQGYIPGLYSPDGSGPPEAWYDQLHAPGSQQVGNIRKLLTSFDAWPHIYPSNAFITTPLQTNENHTMGMRAKDDSVLLVYIPSGQPVEVDVSSLSKQFSSSWFDPVDGSLRTFNTTSGEVDAGRDRLRMYMPPVDETHADWVLVLQRMAEG